MQLRYNREQLQQIRKQLAGSKTILPKEITIKLQPYVLNTENDIKKTHRWCREVEEVLKRVHPPPKYEAKEKQKYLF